MCARSFPWLAVYLLSPFVETFREMLEMRHLWSRSLLLDNRKLVAFLGREPHTPLEQALLTGSGCLPEPNAAPPALAGGALRVTLLVAQPRGCECPAAHAS
jgi:hypothetical protein